MVLPAELIENRQRLEDAMQAEGFIGLPTEWWHFDDPEWTNYALRDEPLTSPALQHDRAPDGPWPPLPDNVAQLVIVTSKNWNATTGQLQRYEKKKGHWHKVGPVWPVALGAKGMSWGCGRHNPSQPGPTRHEGDNTAPAGLYSLGTAYGPAENPGFAWPYQPVDDRWVCVDDPKSARYNQIFAAGPSTPKDWTSVEKMKRADGVYTWVVNVEQNYPEAKAGCGSCIFLHVWRGEGKTTEGCTAMSEENIVTLIKWLQPDAHPMLLQLPQEAYKTLNNFWKR
jgi:D-alanyl-D-alanine dipeptidase